MSHTNKTAKTSIIDQFENLEEDHKWDTTPNRNVDEDPVVVDKNTVPSPTNTTNSSQDPASQTTTTTTQTTTTTTTTKTPSKRNRNERDKTFWFELCSLYHNQYLNDYPKITKFLKSKDSGEEIVGTKSEVQSFKRYYKILADNSYSIQNATINCCLFDNKKRQRIRRFSHVENKLIAYAQLRKQILMVEKQQTTSSSTTSTNTKDKNTKTNNSTSSSSTSITLNWKWMQKKCLEWAKEVSDEDPIYKDFKASAGFIERTLKRHGLLGGGQDGSNSTNSKYLGRTKGIQNEDSDNDDDDDDDDDNEEEDNNNVRNTIPTIDEKLKKELYKDFLDEILGLLQSGKYTIKNLQLKQKQQIYNNNTTTTNNSNKNNKKNNSNKKKPKRKSPNPAKLNNDTKKNTNKNNKDKNNATAASNTNNDNNNSDINIIHTNNDNRTNINILDVEDITPTATPTTPKPEAIVDGTWKIGGQIVDG